MSLNNAPNKMNQIDQGLLDVSIKKSNQNIVPGFVTGFVNLDIDQTRNSSLYINCKDEIKTSSIIYDSATVVFSFKIFFWELFIHLTYPLSIFMKPIPHSFYYDKKSFFPVRFSYK